MPIHSPKSVILPTDFNLHGIAVPAAIGAKLACPDRSVQAIVGDGAFLMTCMEILTAASNNLRRGLLTSSMTANWRRSGRRRRSPITASPARSSENSTSRAWRWRRRGLSADERPIPRLRM